MDNRYLNLINEFESNFNRLVAKYQALKAENETLKDSLKLKNEEIMTAHKEILDLRNDYSNLETAAGLGLSENNEAARQQINKLVREIDKCLTLLNE